MSTAKSTTAAQLTEHFHKVRLTSLTLSISLFLTSVHQGLPSILTSIIGTPQNADLITGTPRNPDLKFFVICLAIAATVSFIHAWALWSGEVTNASESLRASKAVEDEIADIRNQARAEISRLSRDISELEVDSRRLASQEIYLIDQQSLEEAIATAPSDEARKALQLGLTQKLLTGNSLLPEPGPGTIAIVRIHTAARAVLERAGIEPTDDDLNKIAQPANDLIVEYNTHFIAEYNRRFRSTDDLAGAYLTAIDSWKNATVARRNEGEHKIESAIGKVVEDVANLREASATELGKLSAGLQGVLRPLRRAQRSTKMTVYGTDLVVTAAMYLLAMCHAVGRVFGGITGSIADWTNSGLLLLAGLGWWAEAIAVALIAAVIAALIAYSATSPPRGDEKGAAGT